MHQDHDDTNGGAPQSVGAANAIKRILRSRDGAAAIEFALLAIPYFLIVFAILETFVAYTGQQIIANAVETVSRQLRTGNIKALSSNDAKLAFRKSFCDEISIMIKCGAAEIATPNKLFLDVRNFSTFAQIPGKVPHAANGDLDPTSFGYTPGGANKINMVRAYYKWDIITDLMRPYISNIRPSGGRPSYFLIVETATFRNEDYP